MTHVTVTDSTSVTLEGVSGTATVTGPIDVYCESVTVAGTTYTGTVLVASGSAFQTLRYSPGLAENHGPLLVLFLALGLICARFRL